MRIKERFKSWALKPDAPKSEVWYWVAMVLLAKQYFSMAVYATMLSVGMLSPKDVDFSTVWTKTGETVSTAMISLMRSLVTIGQDFGLQHPILGPIVAQSLIYTIRVSPWIMLGSVVFYVLRRIIRWVWLKIDPLASTPKLKE